MDLIELENLRNNIFNELRNQSRIFKNKKIELLLSITYMEIKKVIIFKFVI